LYPVPAAPVTKATLATAFRGYKVDGVSVGTRFAVRYAGATMLVVDLDGEGGYRAQARDSGVLGPDEIRVGDKFDELADLKELQCIRGAGEWAKLIRCTTPTITNVSFSLRLPVDETPDCADGCTLPGHAALIGVPIESIDYQ
jgi:hypothetical protein